MPDPISTGTWFQKEWAVISGAPITFIIACSFVGIAVFLIVRWAYKAQIDTKAAHIEFLTAQMGGGKRKKTADEKPDPIPPNYIWSFVPELAFWQIAWLWVDQEPVAWIPPGSPAYPVLQMLKRDAERNVLPHRVSSEGTINVWAAARREDLKKYAIEKGDGVRPKFLFDNNKNYT